LISLSPKYEAITRIYITRIYKSISRIELKFYGSLINKKIKIIQIKIKYYFY